MNRPPRSHEIAPDSPGYDEAWARDLIAAVGKREARGILATYRRLARDMRLAKADRSIAAKRARALGKLL